MARTNRATNKAAASVDALDNIDLDDMFADDAMFDGLDIDLDHMDDITDKAAASTSEVKELLSSSGARTHRPPAQAQQISTGEASSPQTDSAPKSNRRVTKRKSKYPSFLNDDDDSISLPPNRSKTTKDATLLTSKISKTKGARVSNNTTKNDFNSKKSQIEDDFTNTGLVPLQSAKEQTTTSSSKSATIKGKSNPRNTGKTTSLSATGQALMTTRGGILTPPSGVAAAGQFGGRQKRGGTGAITSFVTLPKASVIKGSKLPLLSRSSSNLDKKQDSLQPKQAQHEQAYEKLDIHSKSKPKLKVESNEGSTTFKEVSKSPTFPQYESIPLTKQSRTMSPVQKEFCGLQPSDTDFYPFMSTLPSEPLMKSNEAYPILDKMHTSFLDLALNPSTKLGSMISREPSGLEAEPIFHLLEASLKNDFKILSELSENDSNNKHENLGLAILSLRKKVLAFDKQKIAADLYTVGSLLQKQHDFLQQNSRNMQRWCKNNLPGSDYSTIYTSKDKLKDIYQMSPIKEPTVLESFERRDIKVKIVFDGVKEPSHKSSTTTLAALLPERFAPPPPSPIPTPSPMAEKSVSGFVTGSNTAATKSKKRKLPTTTLATFVKPVHPLASAVPISPKVTRVTYATIKPSKRRRYLSDQISLTANRLQLTYFNVMNGRRTKLDQREIAMQRFMKDDNALSQTTTGMWQNLEKAGYFALLPHSEIQQRLHEFKTPFPAGNSRIEPSVRGEIYNQHLQESFEFDVNDVSKTTSDSLSASSLFSRIQSLLVEEGIGDDRDSDAYDDENDDILEHIDFIIDESISSSQVKIDMYDLSKLTVDEQTYLHLRSIGFDDISLPGMQFPGHTDDSQTFESSINMQRKSTSMIHYLPKSKQLMSEDPVMNGLKQSLSLQRRHTGTSSGFVNDMHTSELDDVIESMKVDLIDSAELTNRRLSYLESIMLTPGSAVTTEETKRRNEEEALLISKCRQVLVKSKAEMRAKTEKAKANSDDLKLPW